MEEDWDLQAVVRGCCTSSSSSNSNINNSSSFFSTITNTISTTTATTSLLSTDYPWFPPLDLPEQDQLFSFPDLFAPRTPLEDLEQLCRPFLPPPPPPPAPAPATSPVRLSIPSSSTSILPLQQNHHQQVKTEQKPEQLPHRTFTSPTRTATPSPTPRPKRRKNQQKRVVCQVPAEGLSSDMWAWRKYGQKPIKGSPYPRGYYRCSSSKGCLARKQVERSRTDPTMFIITYTAEHNHPLPTHRNSLAGSTRHKGSSSNTVNKPSCSSSSPPTTTTSGGGLSPTTPLSIEEELLQQKSRGGEDEEEVDMEMEMEMEGEEGDDELLIPEGLLSDDLFMELEELTKPGSGTEPGHRPITGPTNSDQFPASFPWITAAGGS